MQSESYPRPNSGAFPIQHILAGALGAVIIADLLFWQAPVGISAVLYAWAIFALAALTLCRVSAKAILVLAIASVPTLDYIQGLSAIILILGLAIAIAQLKIGGRGRVSTGAAAIIADVPKGAIRDISASIADIETAEIKSRVGALARGWAFPVAGSAMFLGLLAQANPIIEAWFAFDLDVSIGPDWFLRFLLWTAVFVVAWPFLSPTNPDRTGAISFPRLPRLQPQVIQRALILFNLVLGLQIGLDVLVLLGGGGLPEGMTYSEYARRGAYPLFAAICLGCGFAMIAHGAVQHRPAVRALLFLWLAQNTVIALSAGQRLHLYVEAYGLTYLRIHAGIGIMLVGLILGLVAFQIWRERDNLWLLTRAVGLSFCVIYTCALVNFADVIARHNLSRSDDLDRAYLIDALPETARASLAEFVCVHSDCVARRDQGHRIEDWREWGFRRWRVDRRMDALEQRLTEQ